MGNAAETTTTPVVPDFGSRHSGPNNDVRESRCGRLAHTRTLERPWPTAGKQARRKEPKNSEA
jgi:hypothetical protein